MSTTNLANSFMSSVLLEAGIFMILCCCLGQRLDKRASRSRHWLHTSSVITVPLLVTSTEGDFVDKVDIVPKPLCSDEPSLVTVSQINSWNTNKK